MLRNSFHCRVCLPIIAMLTLVQPEIASSQSISVEEVIEEYGEGMTEIAELGTAFYRVSGGQAVVAIAPGQIINSSATYQPHLFAELHEMLQRMHAINPADLIAVNSNIERQEEYVYPDQFPVPGYALALTPDFAKDDLLECLLNGNYEDCLTPINPCQGISIRICDPHFSQHNPLSADFVEAAPVSDSSFRANGNSADRGSSWAIDLTNMLTPNPDFGISAPQKFRDLFFEKLGTPPCANVYDLKSDDSTLRAAYDDLDEIFRDLCEDGFESDFRSLLLNWQNVIVRLEESPVLELNQHLSYRPAYDLAMALIPYQEGNRIDWGRITSLKDIRFSSAGMDTNDERLIGFFGKPWAESDQNSNTVVVQTSLTLIGMIHLLDQGLPKQLRIPGVFTGVFASNYGRTEVIALDINLCFKLVGADWTRVQAYSCN